MLSLHVQTGLPLLLMPATCSGKARYTPKVYFPSTELILIHSADPAFDSSKEPKAIKDMLALSAKTAM